MFKTDNFNFKDGLVSRKESENLVMIPCHIDGVEVTSIGDKAFMEKGIVAVNLPNTIKNIGSYAFAYNQLKGIELPSELKTLGVAALSGNILERVKIPLSLTRIEEDVFSGNETLEQLIVPPSVTYISDHAFADTNLDFEFICVADSYAHKYAEETGTPLKLYTVEELVEQFYSNEGKYD